MKILTFIFAFYVLLLPCIPCTDSNECGYSAQTQISSLADNHEGHEHESESCNPFCSCACCGHTIVSSLQLNKVLILKSSTIQKQHSIYKSISLPSNFYGNIWQPPKIG